MKIARFKLTALLLSAAIVFVSCQELAPTAPVAKGPAAQADLIGDLNHVLGGLLMKCEPLPYASDRQTIGPSGGELHIGPHTLTVPPGALRYSVTITAEAPSADYRYVHFEPQGLHFSRSASLTLSYAGCYGLGSLLPKQIAYTDDLLNILNLLSTVDNALAQKATAKIDHFSEYAMSW